MKVSNQFKEVIQKHLTDLAATDPLFAITLQKPKKNIDDCVTYIINQVKASGCNGFADEEIFQMATHYYDEDDIKVGKKVNANVVVNHSIELTEEEKEIVKKKAMDLAVNKILREEREEIKFNYKVELTTEEKDEAKRIALRKLVEEQKEKLIKKKPEKIKVKEDNQDNDTNSQTSLF